MTRKNKTKTLSFRADQALANFIDEKANEAGISDGQWVRGLLIAEMHRPSEDIATSLQEFQKILVSIVSTLEKVRVNQPKVLWHVLTKIGGMDPQEVTELCRSKLMD